ncbi:MAG: GNAT family N-acetyltransferase [Hyphomicrobiaceae bacterium]
MARALDLSQITVRHATWDDFPDILRFQEASLRRLATGQYEPALIERYIAAAGTMPVDLLTNGRMLLLEAQGRIIATGGWAWRTSNGEHIGLADDNAAELTAADEDDGTPLPKPKVTDGTIAEIAGLYVDPSLARFGLAGWLLSLLEDDIRRTGLAAVRIAATLTGLPLCQKNGYRPYRVIALDLGRGAVFHTIGLAKTLADVRADTPKRGRTSQPRQAHVLM